MDWKTSMHSIFDANIDRHKKGGAVRKRTRDHRHEVLTKLFQRLQTLGYRITDLHKLEDRHIRVLVRDAWFEQKYRASTLRDEMTQLRLFGKWIGKPNLVRKASHYLPEVPLEQFIVSQVAKQSKSWTECGIDVLAKVKEADTMDWRFGLMVRVMLSFGLRRMEVLACYPWRSTSDKTGWRIYPNESKTSRPRYIVIETDAQHRVIEYVCGRVKKDERMRWETNRHGKAMSFKKATAHFSYLMRKLGITKKLTGTSGHGLRSQFIENHSIVASFVPPTLSGSGAEMEYDELQVARAVASQQLGHARTSVTGAYYGSFGRHLVRHDKEQLKNAVMEAIDQHKEAEGGETLQEAFREDCKLIAAVLLDDDVAITLGQIQNLWRRYSERHSEIWKKPNSSQEIKNGIFVAATMHRRQEGGNGKEVIDD